MAATVYKAKLVRETTSARMLRPTSGEVAVWVARSIFLYFANDGSGNCKFSVKQWKEKDIERCHFEEA